ncbi:MAG: hypothetical protein ACFCGT_03140 [Sandaracinaceae bacterium]
MSTSGVTVCDPYPEGGALDCPEGEVHFPGDPGCSPIGRACPDQAFPDESDLPPAVATVYVDDNAPDGGDGRRGAPFRTLPDALDAVASGALVVLGAGVYRVDRPWPSGVSLRGRCAQDSSLGVEEGAGLRAVLELVAPTRAVRIEDVTIGPAPVGAVRVADAGPATVLEGVLIREVTGDLAAVTVEAAGALNVRSVVIRDTRATGAGEGGNGVLVEGPAELSLTRAVLERNIARGVNVTGEHAVATLADVAITDTMPQASDGLLGPGLEVTHRGTTRASRVFLARNRESGVLVWHEGSVLEAEDLVVRDTAPRGGDRMFGSGVTAGIGRVAIERAWLEGNRFQGAGAELGAELTLEDVLVSDTRPTEGGLWGIGVASSDGSRLNATRIVVDENHDLGVGCTRGAVAAIEDAIVRGTQGRPVDAVQGAGDFGRGVYVDFGGSLDLRRVLLDRNQDVGLVVFGDGGSEARLVDVTIRETEPRVLDGASGRGVGLNLGAHVDLERVLVADNHDIGLSVFGGGTRLDAEDLVIRGTQPNRFDGRQGRGMTVSPGASVDLSRALIADNREIGLAVDGRVVAHDLQVRGTRASACPECDDPAPPVGTGVGAFLSARVEVSRFAVSGNEVCGLFIAGEARVDLEDGIVRAHPIGICLQVPDYPVALLRQDVDYRDNRLVIESTSFAVPDPVEDLSRL